MEAEHISDSVWESLSEVEKREYVRNLEKSDYQLRRLLVLVECPDHGPCIPFFTDWVKAHILRDVYAQQNDQ